MEKLSFPNKEVAGIFADALKITGSIEDQKDGTVIFAYEEAKAASPEISRDDLYNSLDRVYKYVNSEYEYLSKRISNLARAFAMHKQNHLPNPSSPTEMEKALKGLGMADDYDVKKKVIYVESGDNSLEASYY